MPPTAVWHCQGNFERLAWLGDGKVVRRFGGRPRWLMGADEADLISAPPLSTDHFPPRRLAVFSVDAQPPGRRGFAGGARDQGQLRGDRDLDAEVRGAVHSKPSKLALEADWALAFGREGCEDRKSEVAGGQAVDGEGEVLDVLALKRGNKQAAARRLHKLMKHQGAVTPGCLVS